jgi:hypothetical protein
MGVIHDLPYRPQKGPLRDRLSLDKMRHFVDTPTLNRVVQNMLLLRRRSGLLRDVGAIALRLDTTTI